MDKMADMVADMMVDMEDDNVDDMVLNMEVDKVANMMVISVGHTACPKGVKDEVKQTQRAQSRPVGSLARILAYRAHRLVVR